MQKTINELSKSQLKKLQFEISISEHCNLNCQMCDHFSPLSKVKNLSLNQIKKDLQRLSHLCMKDVTYLRILGGEPLLNPEVSDILLCARKFFPKSTIELCTNGISLEKCDEKFWEVCNAEKIFIVITKYPIKLDYTNLEKLLASRNVLYRYANTFPIKTSQHFPLDINGGQDINDNFHNCSHANKCVFLKNGKLYTCPIAPNIEIFNEYFQYNFILSEDDGIDIFKTNDIDTIIHFLNKPIPFCRYCCVKQRTRGHNWAISKQNIDEWMLTNDKRGENDE